MGFSVFGHVDGDGYADGDDYGYGDDDAGAFGGFDYGSWDADDGIADGVPLNALRLSLVDNTSPVVLMRARTISAARARMMDDLAYEMDARTGLATISGRIRGSSSPSSRYTVNVYFHTDTGDVTGGGCTCPAYARGYDICKHMAALVLAFVADPEGFSGYGATSAVRSSRGLLAAMQRIDEQEETTRQAKRRAAMIAAGTSDGGRMPGTGRGTGTGPRTPHPGEVALTPTLACLSGRWSVQFRVGARGGTSYVLKSIDDLLDDVRYQRYREYGKKLAFTHTRGMFDDRSRALLVFLDRVADVRRAVDLQDTRYGRFGNVELGRHLTLAAAEVARLLDLVAGSEIGLVLDPWYMSSPSTVRVETPVPADGAAFAPIVTMTRISGDVGVDGYALAGTPPVAATIAGERGMWLMLPPADGRGGGATLSRRGRETLHVSAAGYRFVRCPKALEPVADLLPVVCAPPDADGVQGAAANARGGDAPTGGHIAFDDAPLFARTLLPRLLDSGLLPAGNVPKEIVLLRPVACEPEFYLDRDERGVTCEAKARYGSREMTVVPQRGSDFAPGLTPQVGAGRDFGAERAMLDLVRAYFSVDSPSAPARIGRDETTRIVALFDEGLDALRAQGKVFTTPAFDRMLAPKPPSVKVGLSVTSNLVEISPIADEVPPDEVGSLLAAYRRRQRFHRLKDGTFVDLRGADLDALDRFAGDFDLSENELDAGPVTLPGMQAFLLDGELAGAGVVKEPSFMKYVDELKTIDPARYQVPASLARVLRPYQVDGYRWLRTLCDKGFGGILADEMGLGKSVQLITLLVALAEARRGDGPDASRERSLPSLIVCPASLVYNWAAEFAKFAPGVRAVTVAGTKSERRAAIARHAGGTADGEDGGDDDASVATGDAAATVLITSYDLLRRDVDDYRGVRFDVMALDEAQVIKNHTTKIAKAVKAVTAEHRFALTGTPIENRLSELWSIFDFLMPGLLGSYKRFHERYELPISNARAADASSAEGRAAAQVNPESERVTRRLQALVGVFIKRRLKSQVLTDLPDKIETTVTVQLEGEQRKLYAAHEQRLRKQLEHEADDDFATSKIRILAELTGLRQICCDPRLLYANAKDRSAKLAAIAELVSSCMSEGKKALVFSQFTGFLDLIGERLDAQGVDWYRIDGSTPKKRRLELVDRFNADDTPVFLISLKAGNTGLNLVGASVVIHADPWWNAAAQDQATDRAHRIGQRHDVDVYRIVAKDTIEERILELQHTKSALARQFTDASALAGAAPASIASLTRDDLLGLLE
ncbi:DEAD/DEAH box helicase [Bifidobacterium stellenboschense]|uniref:SNF2-related protein n=1 Tax=Bifidobacterium stellenboschense TaxID=762211 RepID=A0A087DKR1_9BIFI|nr:DEAD/DEAH box helicase [Bifidobacterium stellenboschense]KFI96111.1 SNF2-related protein [Bifidobacterium stellenboschense]